MKRHLASAAVAAGLVLLAPAGAMAAGSYGAPPPAVGVSDGVVAPGEAVVFAGSGFQPGSTVSLFAVYEGPASAALAMLMQKAGASEYIGEVEVDSSGGFAADVELDRTGSYSLVAKGVGADGEPRTLTASVSVAGSGSGSGGSDNGATVRPGAGVDVAGSGERSSRTVGSSARELAHTGIDGLGLQVGAAAALVVVGGTAAGAVAVRRRRSEA